MESPCIKICVIAGDHCEGCGRTLNEIANWSRYSDAERRAIMARLAQSFTPPPRDGRQQFQRIPRG